MAPRPADAVALPTVALRDRLAQGALRPTEVARTCLDRIRAAEPQVRAWAWLDEDHVLAQAERLEAQRRSGVPVGPLYGLPVGVKDIVDTRGIPTCNGTPTDAGRVPDRDAWVIARLRAAGAVMMGKTVTTEMAYMHPGPTTNPANPAHTPGGSSQGSAAAVAAGMVPLGIGTQTGGSVIRPAAFCGVVGFKPTFGRIPRTGILMQSPTLDTVGVFARDVAGAALLAEALWGHDPADRATEPLPPPRLVETALSRAPVAPTFARVHLPAEDAAHPDMRDAMAELVADLGDLCFETGLPAAFDRAAEWREVINLAEMARYYDAPARRAGEALSPVLRAAMDRGRAITARDYLAALDWPAILAAGIDEILERADAILCPAAPGPAPQGLDSTGSAIFNGLWTMTGHPAVTLPLFTAGNGLPMGVQLVGRRGDDARLLRSANWLAARMAEAQPEG
ncbi:MAG: amidase [Rhodobacterales bacterium]|nr:amidase [Rhodobacterales bacterium]